MSWHEAMITLTSLTKKHPGTGDPELDLIYGTASACLVIFAGMMSGLTLGLMSLDTVELEVLRRSGTEKEKEHAEKILPLVLVVRIKHSMLELTQTPQHCKGLRGLLANELQVVAKPHLLLVTLLMCNAAAAEALPLFLDRLFNPVTAVIMSVTVVLLFGEIIPQALCSRYGLAIGAMSAWFVQMLIFVCYPIAKPIAWVLDTLLGHQTALFRRAQLKALVEVHERKEHLGGDLNLDEVRVITGALDATEKTASQVMTPLDKVFMLSSDTFLDEDTFGLICSKGHSRVPIHRPGNPAEVLGVLLTKDLLMVDKDGKTPVWTCKIRTLPILPANLPLYDLLKLFETGRSHMAVLVKRWDTDDGCMLRPILESMVVVPNEPEFLVLHPSFTVSHPYILEDSDDDCNDSRDNSRSNRPTSYVQEMQEEVVEDSRRLVLGYNCEAVGIVTIEDVIEELLQQEIVDEHDAFVDNLATNRVNAALIMRNLPKRLRKLAVTQLPRIGPATGIDFTMGTHPHLQEWHRTRSQVSKKHTDEEQQPDSVHAASQALQQHVGAAALLADSDAAGSSASAEQDAARADASYGHDRNGNMEAQGLHVQQSSVSAGSGSSSIWQVQRSSMSGGSGSTQGSSTQQGREETVNGGATATRSTSDELTRPLLTSTYVTSRSQKKRWNN